MFNISPRPELKAKPASRNLLERFKDQDDDDFFGDDAATIKVPKSRQGPRLIPLITPPTPQKKQESTDIDDDFERDFQLPLDGGPLRLSARKEIPRTPVSLED